MAGQKQRSGGAREGAGRLRQTYTLSENAARALKIVTLHRRSLQPTLTEKQVLEGLIDAAWHELDELYQEKAEESACSTGLSVLQ